MAGKVIPLAQSFPEQRPDQVVTYDLLSTSVTGWRLNSDDLVGMRGLRIYGKMAADEQVKAVLNFKRDAITARGWQFKFYEGATLSLAEQEKRIHLFNRIVASLRGSFSDSLNAIMTGRAFGFSITEKVYGQIEVDGKVWPAINMLLGRDPTSFRFYTDEYGIVNRLEQQTQRAGLVEVDRARVIHYVHAPEWDHVYGRSDLREAYRSWYIKDQVLRLWPMYLERFAGGFLHAAVDVDTSLSLAESDSLDDALRNAKSLGAIRTPPGVTLNVIHPPANADAYQNAIEFHDLAIAKALLVPNLLGISNSGGTGAYAQSQTQLEAFYWTLNADATRLEECLNEQLFRDLGDQCWGDGEYPEFKFKPASLEHVKWVVTTWNDMVAKGTAIATETDEAFLRKLMEMPERTEKDKTLQEVKQELAPAPTMPGAAGDPAAATDAEDPAEEGATDEEPDSTEKQTPVGKGKQKMGRQDARAYIVFTTDAARDAWLKGVRTGDGLDLPPDVEPEYEAPALPHVALKFVDAVRGGRVRVLTIAGNTLEVTPRA